MSRLVKPIEYAKEQNISRQAVYAKIKKGLLESKTVDGKIYIILNEVHTNEESLEENQPHLIEVKELLASKDETISVLKESIQDLKHTNTEINTTLRGEIELLKQVFGEMRNLYVKQVDYMGQSKKLLLNKEQEKEETLPIITTTDNSDEECWIELKIFLERSSITKNKKKEKIAKRLKKAYQQNDKRIKLENNQLLMSCHESYEDILR